jgi:hypothetical protein
MSLLFQVQGPMSRSTNVCRQEKMHVILERWEQIYLFAFLFYAGPPQIGWCLPTLVKAIFFTQLTISKVNIFWKHPHTYTYRNNVLSAIWASPSPVKLTHKISHLIRVFLLFLLWRQLTASVVLLGRWHEWDLNPELVLFFPAQFPEPMTWKWR